MPLSTELASGGYGKSATGCEKKHTCIKILQKRKYENPEKRIAKYNRKTERNQKVLLVAGFQLTEKNNNNKNK